MSGKLSKEEILRRFKEVHGDKYDYSLFTEYKNQNIKIKIICPKHGIFEQTPKMHFNKQGCYECFKEKLSKSQLISKEDFLKKAIEKYDSKFDYSLIDYKDYNTKIKIICPKHGVFEQTPKNHLLAICGCYKCSKISTSKKLSSSTEEFIKKAKLIHGDKYDYSLVDYKRSFEKIKIICPKHGIFEQEANSHLEGKGCKKCKKSHGETKIELFLIKNNIEYVFWKTFNNLIDKTKLSYDFYVPSLKLLIEYNGEQHYNKKAFKKKYKKFLIQKHHDWLKRKYAIKNGYQFLAIPYWDFNNIEKILSIKFGFV